MSEQDQLYVKIEGHQELLKELNSVNHIVNNIEEAEEVLDSLRELKHKTIQNIQENVMELNQRIENINSDMPSVDEKGAADIAPKQVEDKPEIDQSVNQLHDQLQTLKSELQELE